jgi:hypothetical protein
MTYDELIEGEHPIPTLIPIEEFKAVLGIDDRDDKLVKFCLLTSTLTIESYCKRKFLHRKHFERIDYTGDLIFTLNEYPVTEIIAVSLYGNGEILEPDLYCVIPDCGIDNDIPFDISFSPAVGRLRFSAIKVIYYAGYVVNPHPCGLTTREFATQTPELETAASRGEPSPLCGLVEYTMPHIPADLSAACLELASWNLNRYKGRRIGMSGNIRGAGIQGEHFELSMPENVKILLEPYRRRII